MNKQKELRARRHRRIRGKVSGTAKKPRLCVFRSNNHMYAQLIDDENNKVLVQANDLNIKKRKASVKKEEKETKELSGKKKIAFEVGKIIATKAKEKKIEKIVFDRAGYKYHGRVKALADGARANGLNF